MNKRDVAVVGIGYWGKNLARNYFELGSLHTICDHHQDRLLEYQEKFPGTEIAKDFQDILSSSEIKKVVIAVPTFFHYSLAKEALIAGKDVFVEKAMCSSLQQARELVELAEKNNCILMVGHLLHYHPAVAKVKDMALQGELGDIYHCSFSRLNFGSVGAEDSALWAFAPHDISILLSLVSGREINEFTSRHKSFFSEKFVDQSWLHFEFSDNLSADIQVGWSYPYAERKFSIMGTKAMVVFDDLQDWDKKITLWNNQINTDEANIKFIAQESKCISVDPKEPLKEECRHFLECCKSRTQPISSGLEGLRVMEVLEMAREDKLFSKVT
ncbi:MAG: scyllo-inositol 2-dehydrogenase (NAD(+)) [Chlamydiae bacterium]|nr:scyllo-inositol 2-dehydrogenase (NAD(+)) [Chlamydiota bacterium]